MREVTVARNYAEALLELARSAGDLDGWGQLISEVAAAVEQDVTLRHFLESPRVSAPKKNEVLSRALQDRAPGVFVRFLHWVVKNRRQMIIPQIATEYHALLDEEQGRVHATVTVSRPLGEGGEEALVVQLRRVLNKDVVPHVTVNPSIIGGIVIRVGDTVMDGSVRRRLAALRAQLV